VIKRNSDHALQQKVNRLIKNSVAFAFANPQSSMDYVRAHAQAMSETVMKKHIDLYVNEFSIDLGKTGMDAVNLMFERGEALGLFKVESKNLMID